MWIFGDILTKNSAICLSTDLLFTWRFSCFFPWELSICGEPPDNYSVNCRWFEQINIWHTARWINCSSGMYNLLSEKFVVMVIILPASLNVISMSCKKHMQEKLPLTVNKRSFFKKNYCKSSTLQIRQKSTYFRNVLRFLRRKKFVWERIVSSDMQ